MSRITGKKRTETLVVYGDARHFHATVKGSLSVPVTSLRRKLGAVYKAVDQKEFRTSKNCSSRFREMAGYIYLREEARESYDVRHCALVGSPSLQVLFEEINN